MSDSRIRELTLPTGYGRLGLRCRGAGSTSHLRVLRSKLRHLGTGGFPRRHAMLVDANRYCVHHFVEMVGHVNFYERGSGEREIKKCLIDKLTENVQREARSQTEKFSLTLLCGLAGTTGGCECRRHVAGHRNLFERSIGQREELIPLPRRPRARSAPRFHWHPYGNRAVCAQHGPEWSEVPIPTMRAGYAYIVTDPKSMSA